MTTSATLSTAGSVIDAVLPARPAPAAETPERAAWRERFGQYESAQRERERVNAALSAAQSALERALSRREHRTAWHKCVPARFADARLEQLPAERATALSAWLDDPARPWCLALTGLPGRGKTYAAVALSAEILARGRAVAFVSWLDYLAAARRAAGGSGEPPDLCRWPGTVVLDDVAAGTATAFAAELLLQVISSRDAELLPLVLTTNSELSAFGGIDGRLSSRLSGALWLSCGGSDLRPDAKPPAPAPAVREPPDYALHESNVSALAERLGLAVDVAVFCAAAQDCASEHCDMRYLRQWPVLLKPWHELLSGETAELPAPGARHHECKPLRRV